MSTNKSELAKLNGYGDKAANDESAKTIYIFCFISVPYPLQEDVELDGNKLAYGYRSCSAIYTFPGWHKSRFYVEPCKRKKCDCVN